MKNISNENNAPEVLTITHENRQLHRTVINDPPKLAIVFKQKQFDEIATLLNDIQW